MRASLAKILAVGAAVGFGLQASLTLVAPWTPSEASAFGRGGGAHFGGHFGGFGGHFGGFGGGRFGGFGHFGGFPHFGGFGFRHFGGFPHAFRFHHFGGLPHRFAFLHSGRFGHYGRIGHYRHLAHGYGHAGSRHLARHFGGRHLGHHIASHVGHFGGHPGARHFAQAAGAGAALAQHALHNEHARAGDLRQFHRRGFNPNGFGALAAWYGFGGDFLDYGWDDWGNGWGYWAGPVFWPYFYGDVLTFILWPYDYWDPFFAYDLDFLLASALWPGPWSVPSSGENYNVYNIYGVPSQERAGNYVYDHWRHHRLRQGYAAAQQTSSKISAAGAEACGGLAPGVPSLPIDDIEKAARPNEAQNATLNDLRSASAQADNVLRASCPKDVPLTPVGRLDVMTKRMQALQQAVQMMRAPLQRFVDSLDQPQKERVEALARGGSGGANNLGGLCNREAESFASLPIQRTEELIKPTGQQRTAFENFKTASSKAAKDLEASCPTEVPKTMAERFEAASKRIDALLTALGEVRPALAEFYNSLTDEQKARFNVIGPARPRAT